MKKLLLSLLMTTIIVAPTCYAQSQVLDAQAQEAKDEKGEKALMGDLFNGTPLEVLFESTSTDVKVDENVFYSKTMKINFIVEYGVPSCPFGMTKYSMDKKTNYGCETVRDFLLNLKNKYYLFVNQ